MFIDASRKGNAAVHRARNADLKERQQTAGWQARSNIRSKQAWEAALDGTTLMEDAAVGGLRPLAHVNNHDKPSEWDWRKVVGLVFATVGLLLAAGGGIGGGGILVPVYIIVMGFSAKVSQHGCFVFLQLPQHFAIMKCASSDAPTSPCDPPSTLCLSRM